MGFWRTLGVYGESVGSFAQVLAGRHCAGLLVMSCRIACVNGILSGELIGSLQALRFHAPFECEAIVCA